MIAARAAKAGQMQIAGIAAIAPSQATASNKYEILTEPTTNPEGTQND
jgi:hypothetical protein